MELAHMASLYNVLKNPTFNPTWETVFDFGIEAAEGMAFLHALQPPLLHRDLKTLNLMVTRQMKIKVGDFGLSIFDNATKGEGNVTGTAAYLAPETIEGAPFTIKADVYAFAVVFWELVNTLLNQEYQAPFEEYKFKMDMQILYAVSARDLRPTLPKQCPPEILKFIDVCWNKTPEERPDFPTVVQQLRDLQVLYKERKAAWDKTICASWMENAQGGAASTQADQTTSPAALADQTTSPTVPAENKWQSGSTTPTGPAPNFAMSRSVSTSQVHNNPSGTIGSGMRRKVSDAGKQSVMTAEFSFKREKAP